MTDSTFAARNQRIYEMANSMGRSQGALARIAETEHLTRQRISAIIKRIDKLQGTNKNAHEPYNQTMGAWCASDAQRDAFYQYCVNKNLNHAAGMRKAVDLLLATPEFEGKEETGSAFDKLLGPWKTTKAQSDAFAALRLAKAWTHAEAMRLAVQLLLTNTDH